MVLLACAAQLDTVTELNATDVRYDPTIMEARPLIALFPAANSNLHPIRKDAGKRATSVSHTFVVAERAVGAVDFDAALS